jgi:hypothetical protein
MYESVLRDLRGVRGVFALICGLAAGWWVYVPIHELMHAAGCLVSGGEVAELKIQSVYGGDLLGRMFSFVVSGGDYAGRLTGFDTNDSDFTYAATVYFPYLLSLPGFFLLNAALRRKSRFLFAFAIPVSLAPLIGLTGDFFELGSLWLFQVWPGAASAHRSLISDDVFRLFEELESVGADVALFIASSFLLGLAISWGTLFVSERINSAVSGSSR